MLGICRPIHYFWDEFTDPSSGSCTNTNEFLLVAGIINMVIDIVIVSDQPFAKATRICSMNMMLTQN